ncbi:lytic polysaccharide monooxygenase [Pseudomonas sp. WJP1]|uniref:lytic polysaccharide monooxygenase n=1 Tax=Pseudomonas sp. WJP1 TaxID=2986947 RepID=UPI00234BE5F3|nr:lytic polysaccharide monooxygenase [Pseudomonas sp. WJP1]WCM54279.1 lytic polysaccharide monooxygenase [Pseudomonas sp. WJP1]
MSQRRPNTISRSNNPRHGHVFSPSSRAHFEWLAGRLDEGALNQREGGKFFPLTTGGVRDVFAKDDDANVSPPPDGKIASAGQQAGAWLDEPGSHWQKHDVRSSETLDISWHFSAKHAARRWNYFMTKEGWDPDKVLSRSQFEEVPFYTVQINLQPHWAHGEAMLPESPTIHGVPLPRRNGYHVCLAVWEVANTSMAFYQVIDLNFVPPDGGGELPDTPTGLSAVNVTDKQVLLKWNAATGPFPIVSYRIWRNGGFLVEVESPNLTFADKSVVAETQYNYDICSVDDQGKVSARSRPIQVHTLPEGGEGPTAPTNLHSMGQTAQSVSLMWGASTGTAPIVDYLIYRDDSHIKTVSATQTSFDDAGLTPNTQYRYSVKARDLNNKLSLSSNVLSVRTQGDGGEHPAWKLGTQYAKNDIVSHAAKNWTCIQAHTAHTADWAPGEGDNVLWKEHA